MTGDVSKHMATGENVSQRAFNRWIRPGSPSAPARKSTPTWHHVPVGRMEGGRRRDDGRHVHRKRRRVAIDHRPRVLAGYRVRPSRRRRRARAQSQRRGQPANAFTFDGVLSTNYITALGADGFTVGNDKRVNRAGTMYHYVAWNEIPGKMDVGTYTGNGADNRNITGVGFQPDFVMVQTDSGLPDRWRTRRRWGHRPTPRTSSTRPPTRPTRFNCSSQTVSRSARRRR